MPTLSPALRLSIYLGGGDSFHHRRPLSTEIIHRAHRAGIHGATTLQGMRGFGASAKIHAAPVFGLIDRSPVVVVIVDAADRIRAFVPMLDDLADQCLILCDEVEIASAEPGNPRSS